jgi:predicted nucleic acid-binding protein
VTTLYLDSSVALRVMLRQSPVLAAWGRWDLAFASEILGVEARRVLDRLRLDRAVSDVGLGKLQEQLAVVERGVSSVALTRTILQRAALPMATPVRTLDAIHLATALVLRERRAPELRFATHDAQQATAARALGFVVVGA